MPKPKSVASEVEQVAQDVVPEAESVVVDVAKDVAPVVEEDVKEEVAKDAPELSDGLVEVEHALGEVNWTYFGGGFNVLFEKGKAFVSEEVAKLFKELKLIK